MEGDPVATDWIVWTKGLLDKPEIIRMSRDLKVTPEQVACACMRLWEWADDQTVDGFVPELSHEDADKFGRLSGLGRAMVRVGWLVSNGDNNGAPLGISFPNWPRWNTNSAKRRLYERDRKRAYRQAMGQ